MTLTTDPNHPDLGHGGDTVPGPQNKAYLVLSEEERAKGFIRPIRTAYRHIGDQPRYPVRDLTEDELKQHEPYGYVKYEKYPDELRPRLGRFWTQAQLDAGHGCGTVTTMGMALAETYAREPKFYGFTYCCNCMKHLPVAEFVWDGTDDDRVGS